MPLAAKPTYRRLFIANTLALVATGVATVALALLAFELAGDDAGAVLGNAMAIKMGVNVLVAPVATVLVAGIGRPLVLKALTGMRVLALLALPFVTRVEEVYLLIALFQVGAATAYAVYIATVDDLLPHPDDFARAIGKSKIAYEVEGLFSPLIAAVLLLVMDPRHVFFVCIALFAASVIGLWRIELPASGRPPGGPIARLGRDVRRLLTDRAILGAFLVNAAAISIAAMVTVNTVVLVRGVFDLGDRLAAVALASFGFGGIVAALLLPRLVARAGGERGVMVPAGLVVAALVVAGVALRSYAVLLVLWFALGFAATLAQLPIKLMLARLKAVGGRQGIHAAASALDHGVLFFAYLAAGWVGATLGQSTVFFALSLFTLAMVLMATWIWPTVARKE